jgi:hypothetical protein
MYKKLIITAANILLVVYGMQAQTTCREVRSPEFRGFRQLLLEQIANNPRLKAGTECDKKIVRLNIYYMQDDNGQNNFSATGDGTGSSYNGKDFAYDMIRNVNNAFSYNVKLRIPPNNTIPMNHKDIQFVIEGIYYIRNSRLNREIDTTSNGSGGWMETGPTFADLAAQRIGPIDSVVHFFVHGVGIRPEEVSLNNWVFHKTYGGGGWGGDIVKVGTYARYWALKNKRTIPGWLQNDTIDWVWDAEGKTWAHELGHSLSLSHTVRYPGGALCPTIRIFGATAIDSTCDDGIPSNETPSAWYMTDTLLAPIHPGERGDSLRKQHPQWWSNNMMDYTHEHALSPIQIELMHHYLTFNGNYVQNGDTIRGNARRWLVESEQRIDRNYCTWIANRIAHYGRRVELNRLCAPNLRVQPNTNRKIIASQTTEIFGGFEVMARGEFEIVNTCPKP